MTMTVYEFLEKLNKYYPSKEKEGVLEQKVNDFANCILEYMQKSKLQYDFDKIFKKFMLEYRFKVFPNLPDILEFMPYGIVYKSVKMTGDEGKIIKRTWQGYEYEFTVVPNSWDNVKTIAELDADINRRNGKNENARREGV